MRDFLSQWDEFTVSAEEFVDGGETVLVTEPTGTGRESGAVTSRRLHEDVRRAQQLAPQNLRAVITDWIVGTCAPPYSSWSAAIRARPPSR